ncbi:MAG: flippase-like domain-containing protein [Candidatus Aminicenantes bacterium]|nr:flippase-like domain-containing protein [Candidatus Aminicenantes bacterium]
MDTSQKKRGRGSGTLRIILGLAVTVLALWLTFKDISWPLLWDSLRRINLWWTALALVVPLATVYALGIRWRILLDSDTPLSLGKLFQLNIISQFANIIMPARLGDVLRIYLGSRQFGLSAAHVTGTVVIEKGMDFIVFVAFWAVVPPLLAVREGIRGTGIAVVLCLAVLAVIVLLAWKREFILRMGRVFSRILPGRFRDRFNDLLERSIQPFALFKDSRKVLVLVLLTFVFVLGMVFTNHILFLALGLPLSFGAALVVLLALQVANLPPSTPGKVGIFQYAVILALSWFGVEKDVALAYGLVLHVVAFLPKIILGLIYISRLDISLKKKYHIA